MATTLSSHCRWRLSLMLTRTSIAKYLRELCFFLSVVVPVCLAVDASEELKHVRFISDIFETMHMDHCHNHCQNGVCVGSALRGYHCQCDDGWYGVHCEYQHSESTHTDHCHNHCQHGVCVGSDRYGYYHCQCDSGWHGVHCEQQQQHQQHLSNSTCDISAITKAVTTQTRVVNENATQCSTGSHSSHDALVLTHCHVPNSVSSWKQGINVMSRCNGSASLPANSPVAAFINGVYSSKGSLSGIFIACTSDGFKMAFQLCGQPPQVADMTMGRTNALNPAVYYTVV